MSKPFQLFVKYPLPHDLPKSGKTRDKIDRFLFSLESEADFLAPDEVIREAVSGREWNVSIVCGFAISWWIDGPAKEVNVMEITKI